MTKTPPRAVDAVQLLQRRHWIFDLDGTLTRPVHDFVAMRRQLGVPEGEDILHYIAGRPTRQRQQLELQLLQIEQQTAHQAQASEGMVELLRALRQRGCKLGILTRNQRDCVHIILQRLGIDGYFCEQSIVAAEDARPKPDPEGIHRLLDLWQATADDALIVGDFRYDLEAGRNAAILSVHYAADRHERWPEVTDYVVEHFAQLHSALNDG